MLFKETVGVYYENFTEPIMVPYLPLAYVTAGMYPLGFHYIYIYIYIHTHTHTHTHTHSRVLLSDGSFYEDSLLRPLSSRTEHFRLVVHHCRNSRVLSALSALLALFRCACVSSFSILVQFYEGDCNFSTHDFHQKTEKKKKIKTADVTFFFDVF